MDVYMSLAEELGLERGRFTDPGEEAILGVLRTADMLSRIGDRMFSKGGVSQAQFNILKILSASEGGMSQKEILDQLISTKGNLSIHITNLVERRLVSRRMSKADGRRHVIKLTARGRQVLDSTEPQYRRLIAEITGNMKAGDLRAMIELVDKLRARCPGFLNGDSCLNGGANYE